MFNFHFRRNALSPVRTGSQKGALLIAKAAGEKKKKKKRKKKKTQTQKQA